MLERAFELADRMHAEQTRKTGEAFIFHPLAVTQLLAEYGLDEATLAAGILHDTVEDTALDLEDLRREFGNEIADLIDGVTKLDRVEFEDRDEAQAATIRKMVIAMADDVRVLVIKLADRLHNIRTLGPFAPEKQERIAHETLEVYAPLAHRLGMQEIKHEMEDSCFAILHPRRNREIRELLAKRAPAREGVIEAATREVSGALDKASITAAVTGRPKHPYSIYRKMIETGSSFEELHDLIGIRIITDDITDCYGALGVVHTLWPPVHGRFKDYIATPKFNLYQSLHTTVVGPAGKPLEVQIRTRDMHARAERGVAAHWGYKEGAAPGELAWMADIHFLRETYDNPEEFLAGLKIDLYRDEVFAVTPKGKVLTLPKGATPVDFAYAIHTEVGHRCVGAKVNGRLVALNTQLKSGDIVEISTSRSQSAHPSRDWLKFAQTSRAAAKIRQWFNRERRHEALSSGKEQILSAVAREGLGLTGSRRDRLLEEVGHGLSYQDLEALYAAVGEGNVSSASVVARLVRLVRPDEAAEDIAELLPVRSRFPQRLMPDVVVEGHEDLAVRIARCCAPVPGDEIVGFVTVGGGVSVHRADCTNLGDLAERSERMIDVTWSQTGGASFAVWIQVEALDRTGLLRDVTAVLSDLGANILTSSSVVRPDRTATLRYEVEFSDPNQLEQAIADLRDLDGIYDASRLLTGD
ncbi:MAG: bifunctional (p)ppGpp synthetase/guanosine-3',5'-bis(diphosphate) 3'-pyrophosphohydrolase [Acidimicrobiia bacterium]|nr:bifunctional (p)ppGpp synthetase/guanosine-3',5'-bis(diphosphate) 3'-pyrophosphohydrolase [Acidimicrobiia bacterium]MBT8192239.1 bifunctional (p)ppGpp synthetase/guanosine-3',5'-bis(diphosphate) 3'-pyrophosphohydrolase [Acidimicrobiia bacterium]NNF88559.1 bifunctional (p)ppGpp synthetase/guanosine-3',5'-bis(diphosphate) 3'-pyrophosphohydrolase [Acidimicrobiia bacterium]NNL12970.1 bifunctional (p)ppGpp synthetase/guanosine-3',5'-bis(diphosphate) 3'-pyrophosphohydrolase [Acidimicrobiia bacteriu